MGFSALVRLSGSFFPAWCSSPSPSFRYLLLGESSLHHTPPPSSQKELLLDLCPAKKGKQLHLALSSLCLVVRLTLSEPASKSGGLWGTVLGE